MFPSYLQQTWHRTSGSDLGCYIFSNRLHLCFFYNKHLNVPKILAISTDNWWLKNPWAFMLHPLNPAQTFHFSCLFFVLFSIIFYFVFLFLFVNMSVWWSFFRRACKTYKPQAFKAIVNCSDKALSSSVNGGHSIIGWDSIMHAAFNLVFKYNW